MLHRGLTFRDICTRFAPPRADDFRTLWNAATPAPAPDCLVKRGIVSETLAAYRPLIRCDEAGRGLFAHRNNQRSLTCLVTETVTIVLGHPVAHASMDLRLTAITFPAVFRRCYRQTRRAVYAIAQRRGR